MKSTCDTKALPECIELLSADDGAALLRLSRSAVEARIVDQYESFEIGGFQLPAGLLRHRGAFVTIRDSDGALRGCMGCVTNTQPLATAACRAAMRSATEDPRFDAVQSVELRGLRFEVSALGEGDRPDTPFCRVGGPEEIEIGRDGLMVRHTGHRMGLLLPQVAVNQSWNALAFLAATCRKAGLSATAWESNEVELYRFTAQVFSEA